LMWAHIEYMRASKKLRERLDMYVGINNRGGKDTGLSKDMQNELFVCLVKTLFKSMKIRTGLQADRAILDLPVSSRVIKNDQGAVGINPEDRSTAYAYLT
jgi:hypothetical protein